MRLKKEHRELLKTLQSLAKPLGVTLVGTELRGSGHLGTIWQRPAGGTFTFVFAWSASDHRAAKNVVTDFRKKLQGPLQSPTRAAI